MKSDTLLFFCLAAFVVVGLLHIAAEFFYFYWTVFWFDIMMHFLGGIAVALATLWAVVRLNFLKNYGNPILTTFFTTLTAVLVVSFFWEVLEHLTGTAKALEGYVFDTTMDTSAALLGAALTSSLVSRRIFQAG